MRLEPILAEAHAVAAQLEKYVDHGERALNQRQDGGQFVVAAPGKFWRVALRARRPDLQAQ